MNLLGMFLSAVLAFAPPASTQDIDVSRQYEQIPPCAIVSAQEVRADYQIVDENGVETYRTNRNATSERTIPTRPSTSRPVKNQNGMANGNYTRGSANNGNVVRNDNVTYRNGSPTNQNGMANGNYTRGSANNGNTQRNTNTPRTLELNKRDYANTTFNAESTVKNEILSYYNEIAKHKSEIAILRAKCRAKVREYEDSLYENRYPSSQLNDSFYQTRYVR